jgi:signal transduction histidine kinase
VQRPIEDPPRDDELLRLLGATGDGLVLLRSGAVAWANAALARMAGVDAGKDLVGLPLDELLADAGHGVPSDGTEGPSRCRLLCTGRDDRAVVVEPISGTWAGGDLALRIRDVTEVHTLESEVLRTGRALHDANRALASLRERSRSESAEREELLTVVSHELRTPCTVIQGYNRLLLSGRFGDLSEKQRYFLEESQKSCQRLNTFIGNLLETARQGLAVGPLEVAEAPLAPVVEGVVRQLGPLLEEHRLRIELRIATDAPRARFDPPRVEQVLTNLIGNALKFAPANTVIEITLGAAERAGRRYAEIAVLDRGPGVDARDGERIFEPYVQAGETRRAGGLGLGLAICRRIVEAHGGQIGVEPRPEGGSRFVFTLPAVEPVARTGPSAGAAA